jgi:hypothetical protein
VKVTVTPPANSGSSLNISCIRVRLGVTGTVAQADMMMMMMMMIIHWQT